MAGESWDAKVAEIEGLLAVALNGASKRC